MRSVKTIEKHLRKCFQQMNNMCIVAGVHLFLVKVGVEESIVNALRITDQLFESYRCLCFYTEWCVHNRQLGPEI
jgi:hypothetical protein